MHKAIERKRERQREIINFLKSNEKVFLRGDLAEVFGVSLSTIGLDLHEIRTSCSEILGFKGHHGGVLYCKSQE